MPREKIITILGALLFLSLAGNLFMAGHMLGERAALGEKPPLAGDARKAEWKKRDALLRERLSPADRKVFEEAKAQNRPRIEALKKDLEAARERVAAAQMTDPFDAQALEQAVREEAEKKAAFLAVIREMRRDIAQRLSPEGRAQMEKLAPRGDRAGKDGRRRGMLEKMRERRMDGDRPFLKDGGRSFPRERGFRADPRPFPPEGAPPPEGPTPVPPPEEGYGEPPPPDEPPPAPPPPEDCGGCEVPGDFAAPEAPPEP